MAKQGERLMPVEREPRIQVTFLLSSPHPPPPKKMLNSRLPRRCQLRQGWDRKIFTVCHLHFDHHINLFVHMAYTCCPVKMNAEVPGLTLVREAGGKSHRAIAKDSKGGQWSVPDLCLDYTRDVVRAGAW